MSTRSHYRIPALPAAARKAGATKIQRTAGDVFAVGFRPDGDPDAVFAALVKQHGADAVTWQDRDPAYSMIVHLG
jgi:hypothetical protein